MKINSTQATFRILAGGYLIYLDYKMISDGVFTENSGLKLVLLVAAILVFAAFGAFFIYQGLKAINDASKEQPAADDEQAGLSETGEDEFCSEDGECEDGQEDESSEQEPEEDTEPPGADS